MPTSTSAPPPPSTALADTTGARLLVASYSLSGHSLSVLDVDHGTSTAVPLPAGLDASANSFQLVAREGAVVMLGALDTGAGHAAQQVYCYRALDTVPSTIGQATVILPADRPDRVWLSSGLATGIAPSSVRLDETDLDGRQTASVSLAPPTGAVIVGVAVVSSGFVVSTTSSATPSGRLDLYDRNGRIARPIGEGTLLAAQDTEVVWLVDQRVWVTDLATGSRHALPGLVTPVGQGSLSPDGSELAIQESPTGGNAVSPLAVIDLPSGATTTGPPIGYVPPVWDASSSKVFFAEPDGHHVEVWPRGGGGARMISGPALDAVAMGRL